MSQSDPHMNGHNTTAVQPSHTWLGGLFIGSVFVSAFLMFVVQPLIGRMLLPRYGGTPAVWNTALVFFQIVLLVGYAYAHGTVRLLGVRRQLRLHVLVVLVPLVVLPLRLLGTSDGELTMWPMARVLWVLLLTVGLPLLALSANSSLVQRWFAQSGSKGSGDPYRLYAASNVGSVLGLLAYPFLLEPLIGLSSQTTWWTLLYGVFVVLSLVLIVRTWRASADAGSHGARESVDRAGTEDEVGAGASEVEAGTIAGAAGAVGAAESQVQVDATHIDASGQALTWRRRAGWSIRAGVAVSLLMSTTTQITTEVAPVPLLWVLPLLVYLLTFIVAFGWPDAIPRRPLALVAAIALTISVGLLLVPANVPSLAFGIGSMTLMLGAAALLCHVDIAKDRPGVSSLTEFYLWISLGGALGGVLNSLVAPVLFNWVAEYPLTLIAVAATITLAPGGELRFRPVRLSAVASWVVPLLMFVACLAALGSVRSGGSYRQLAFFVPFYLLLTGLVLAPLGTRWRAPGLRWSFVVAVSLATVFAAGVYTFPEQLVEQDRSFFGVRRVVDTASYRVMAHGSTSHGSQALDPERRHVPSMYYHPDTPMGRVTAMQPDGASIGGVGLGTGALAALAKPGQRVVYYEIDPLSDRMAREQFTYLADAATDVEVILGDGRLVLEREADGTFDLLILDAFQSDSVPTHLLTEEAVRLYLEKLVPEGIVVFHISSRYLDLKPVLAGAAQAVGAHALVSLYEPTPEQREWGASKSEAVALSASEAVIDDLAGDGSGWRHLDGVGAVLWTDDHVNLLPTLRR